YDLEVGALQTGDPADMIIVDNLNDFRVLATYVNGTLIARNGKTLIRSVTETVPNNFHAEPVSTVDISVSPHGNKLKVMEALDGQLITNIVHADPKIKDGNVVSDPENDILKIVVLNRYNKAKPAVAFIRNFGLKRGAIASSVAHDSHNIVAVGADDEQVVRAINLIIKEKGGVSLVDSREEIILPLPVAGLMSVEDGYKIAEEYHKIDKKAHELGSTLRAPFMTLSFMALLVIPDLKLSDKGLFDGRKFSFTNLFS
ncbi:MAG: adenine deaminase, partial [Bacteroidetes bacterium]